MRDVLGEDLAAARARTRALTDLDDAELVSAHHPLMSPLVWDLAHIGQQEELWLLRRGDPARPGLLTPEVDALYDAFLHPRAERPSLPLLGPAAARSFCDDVRGRVLDLLRQSEDLFPFAMVVQHEQQHDETMAATLQLREGSPLLGGGCALPAGREAGPERVLVAGGPFTLGVDGTDEPWSLDNERPAHTVAVASFELARLPVSNAQWRAFVDDGGYAQPRWWSDRGWKHRVEAGLERPLHWRPDGSRRRFGQVEPIPPDEPVQHVSFFEAEAYAAWAGGRLPTEWEWEKACAWDPDRAVRRRWPWGDEAPDGARANLGGAALRPAPLGAYPAGASAYGVEQLIGDVWEWTSSDFTPWPGFRPMLYATYSEPFFGGDYKVLRGGSWAVGTTAIRPSFRNWDHPYRRQIFAGVRVAWDT
ncbi:MAG: ergothioneine biosynthesis protein EgtB [Actinomycetota bacterium]|nr:ergothioneine biosynthesis protein EgtB [Actinomycetota bacterium]